MEKPFPLSVSCNYSFNNDGEYKEDQDIVYKEIEIARHPELMQSINQQIKMGQCCQMQSLVPWQTLSIT